MRFLIWLVIAVSVAGVLAGIAGWLVLREFDRDEGQEEREKDEVMIQWLQKLARAGTGEARRFWRDSG